MIHSTDDFTRMWAYESDATLKVLRALTDASLAQRVTSDGRSLGEIAWHIVTSIPEMMGRTGLEVDGPEPSAAAPTKARAIVDAYDAAARSLCDLVREKWTDATLEIEDDMYGERWKRGQTLGALVAHQTHHRGQMTVLMRQAGLRVPGVYGPAKEDWADMGMEPQP